MNTTKRKVYEMTQAEIERRIFKGVGTATPRGFSDAFTPSEIVAIQQGPMLESFDERFRDWLWNAYANATGMA